VVVSPVIEIEGLGKAYTRRQGLTRTRTVKAVDRLDLEVPEGGVFGFLGPNGSGKTTTIRCLLGLVRPTRGRCRVLGAPPGHLVDVIQRVGSIVETPAHFPTFTGRQNLRLLADLGGFKGRDVEPVLERVGLGARGDDLVRTYSLGMKQRLGLAAALLKDPDLLILDEPANGMDPAGIREIRLLLRSLADEGRTVFVSSHLLTEVQQTCDRVAILSRGRCITQGTVDEVLQEGATAGAVLVRVEDLEAALEAVRAAGFTAALRDGRLRVEVEPDRAAEVTKVLAAADHFVTEVRPDETSLEDVFLRLTEGDEP